MLEAIARFEELIGKTLDGASTSTQNRVGDHICYISDLRRLRADYPGWELTRSLDDILRELAAPPAAETPPRAHRARGRIPARGPSRHVASPRPVR